METVLMQTIAYVLAITLVLVLLAAGLHLGETR